LFVTGDAAVWWWLAAAAVAILVLLVWFVGRLRGVDSWRLFRGPLRRQVALC